MSKFEFLQQQLDLYDNLESHRNPILAQRLHDVQLWQKQRMQNTHADFFKQPEHQLMAAYFLNRLYGAEDFNQLAFQIRRLVDHVHIVEKVIPASALKTGDAGVELARLSIQLDEDIAKHLLAHYPENYPLNDDIMRQAYLDCDQANARYHQMELLELLGEKLDLYVRSRMVKTAFKLSKKLAYHYKVDPIYDFIDEGFKAMQPLDSAQKFVGVFTSKERQIIAAVHAGHPQPFSL
ncbi:FFLEELY motif protein [Acinetobacter populi]|uniref:DUF8198 domain-containing protein n=1 Tax=Acinetobacter populi TaxID=1582270 RepID=A0A1Z9Z386_9GAMM|nr:hypothetical protein [Acinetobacter populi]OUY08887.1 hypothetical protein CAP51_04540 [Acinetobacter populi]